MPIYEYECPSCGQFEVTQRITEESLKRCPHCKKRKVRKLMSNTSFQLKGSGWYITDYARKGGAGPGSGESKGPGESSGEAKGAGEAKGSGESSGESKGSSESKSSGESKSTSKSSEGKRKIGKKESKAA